MYYTYMYTDTYMFICIMCVFISLLNKLQFRRHLTKSKLYLSRAVFRVWTPL